MTDPPVWNADDLRRLVKGSKAAFRRERLEEPLERYLDEFENWQGVFEEIFEASVDLTRLDELAFRKLLPEMRHLEAFRYLAGPPISADDLKTVAEVASIAPGRLESSPEILDKLVAVVVTGLDRRRFEWVREQREASPTERAAAILASASLLAAQRVQTWRRTSAKRVQEGQTIEVLVECGFKSVAKRPIYAVRDAPQPGEYCSESTVVGHKADIIVGLWDRRVLLVECKTTNSEVNSFKRVNHEAAGKAKTWLDKLGTANCVPAAVLSGVFKVENLQEAQERGLTLFWAHEFDAMKQSLNSVKQATE
jgi:hypothetical protein